MQIPVRCFSCNKVIGDKFEFFTKEKDNETNKKSNKKLLDDLGLNRYCCRRHMISTVDLMDKI